MKIESHYIPFMEGERLHVRRFCTDDQHPALLLIHGSIENGKIFYSSSGKGFAPWMAQNGYDVYVVDLRGRGQSTPPINRNSTWGQAEALADEYPAIFAWLMAQKGSPRIYIGTHSWAGVNVLAYLARTTMPLEIPAMVFFGAKRHISVRPFPYYFFMIKLGWNLLARRSVRKWGYLDAVKYRMGSDNITTRDWLETDAWVVSRDAWVHWQDGFDYRTAFAQMALPPTLYIAGIKDRVLGHPKDVALLAAETGAHQPKKLVVLSRANGNNHDYGHIDMLTHPDAPADHFPLALDWLQNAEKMRSLDQ
jgi:pimeloyl-ACP methyl ester carboxylesterase